MKKEVKSYITFTRTERFGLIALLSLLALLTIVRLSLPYFIQPKEDKQKNEALVTAWERFKELHPDNTSRIKKDYQDVGDDNPNPLPDIINLNNVDSATLVRLKGIGPATAHLIIEHRKNEGPFVTVDQLSELRHFPDTLMILLKQHLVIGPIDTIRN